MSENIITVNIQGGLGNQMFQIATLYAIARKYNIKPLVANISESPSIFKNRNVYWDSVFSKVNMTDVYSIQRHKYIVISEKSSKYTKININQDHLNSYLLNGYFQSPKYFNKHRDMILDLFTLPDNMMQIINNIKNEITSSFANNKMTVAIHVRRGDYLKLSHFHIVQNMTYYNMAMDLFDNHNFIVFSDDIEWCKQNFNCSDTYFMDYNNIKTNINMMPLDVIEMYLMACFDHNIIGNSSFSWWSAWMNKNIDKKIVAPSKWFGDKNKNDEIKDIYDEGWFVL